MVKLGGDISANLMVGDEEVKFTFRQPTNEELNDFLKSRFNIRGRKMIDRSVHARKDFFDKLLTGVGNLEDEQGKKITAEDKDKIPDNWKQDVIFRLFEDSEIEIKNS